MVITRTKKILVYKNVNKKDRLFIRSWQTAVCGHCGVGKRWKREREMENREEYFNFDIV